MLSGKKFKELHPYQFIALTDKKPFQQPIHFISLNDLADNLIMEYKSMLYYADVIIPDECDIIIDPNNKFSSSNIILSEIKELVNHELWFNEDFCKKVVVKYHYILKFVKCQNYEICKLAVDFFSDNFQYVRDKTYDLCLTAVKENGLMLQYIENQTYELCLYAVRNNGFALQYVKFDQTEELCVEAVKSRGDSLQYVKNQTFDMCKIAIEKYPRSFEYIKDQTDELCWVALKNNPYVYTYIKNPSTDMLNYAVEYCPILFRRLENPSNELLLLALRQSTWILIWDDIRSRMTFEMYQQAVKSNGLVLEYVENPTYQMCHDAVTNHCLSLKFIKDKTIYDKLYDMSFNLFENKYHDVFQLIEHLEKPENRNIKWIEEHYSKEKLVELTQLYFNLLQNIIWGFKEKLDTYKELFDKYNVDHYKGNERYYQTCVSDGEFEIIGNHHKLLYAIVHSNPDYIFEFIMGNFTKLIEKPLDIDVSYDTNHDIKELMYKIKYGDDGRIGKVTIINEWNPDYSDSRYQLPDWLNSAMDDMKAEKEENKEI